MNDKRALQIPDALQSLGEEVFLQVPLYATQAPYKAVYIDEALFREYFDDENTNFSHMAEIIEQHFSTTLNPDKANGKPIGFAYIDRQADPLKLSLNDNLGSGRAYYQGDIFNIKEEKTPLAQSTLEYYSNGVLELEKALFETIASNSLYGDVEIKLSPVLAVLDIQEPCTVHWKNKLCQRAKIIRLNLQGSLNRITHLFQAPKPLTRSNLIDMAQKIGAMEGEKFIRRIEHGAWSAGNISPNAHMIDFDTVCSVKYWAPQYSFTQRFIDNYFGHEYLGQLKILKSVVATPEINVERVSYPDIKSELLTARESHIRNAFPSLVGFKEVPSKYQPQLISLVKMFIKLSARCYPVIEELELKFIESQFCAPFNFAKFFRLYPILKRCNGWNTNLGLEVLVDCVRENVPPNPIRVSPLEPKNKSNCSAIWIAISSIRRRNCWI